MLLQRRDISRIPRLTVEFARQTFWPLAFLFFSSFFVNHYFENLAQELNASDQGPWIAQIGSFLASLLEGFALLLIGGYYLVRRQEKIGWRDFFRRFMAPLTAESLRAMTRILLWTLAFIVPGIVVFFRLTFVPYIVFLEPKFPDSVRRSMQLTKPCWGRLTLVILLINIFDGVFELAPNLLKIDDLMARLFFDLGGFLFSLFEFVLLYIIFENLRSADSAKGETWS